MRDFKSNDDFLAAMRDLIERIDKHGNSAAARELRNGFSCLNGLTDGWALLMESIGRTITSEQGKIAEKEMSELRDIFKSVRKIVYRK